MLFCTQFHSEGWYDRINGNPENVSPICEAIMDRITNNAYPILIDGKIPMRRRHELPERADILCHGNWIEIQRLSDCINKLKNILDKNGIEYPTI